MSSQDLPDGVDEETVTRMMRRVLEAEKDKLHMGNPIGINDDIESIIEDEIK
ncbi:MULTISPECIES: hypothetical protein [Halorubrum]|jgi:hypothetical protein|uniref:hypothetical protein n=1 Tax=Halorubrum TaxID=56688 RepID=UPI0018E9F3FB|nr:MULTISPECIES: hypothetical protein [Halorubrum]MDB9235215.1 hypothetical protein [Halorubrum ezzemoulense]